MFYFHGGQFFLFFVKLTFDGDCPYIERHFGWIFWFFPLKTVFFKFGLKYFSQGNLKLCPFGDLCVGWMIPEEKVYQAAKLLRTFSW